MYQQDGFYFVTARTMQARLLLRPSPEMNLVLGGVLARAVQRFPVELFGFVFASNHLHLLLRARDGSLSHFMQYLLGNIARKAGRLVDWRGPFWERRFSAETVLDDAAMEARLKYILAHGVKEGLVRRVEDWPGLSCVSLLLGNLRARYQWFSWTRRWSGGRLKEGADQLLSEAWAESVVLELSVLPRWSSLDDRARRASVRELISSIEDEGRLAHPAPLGRAAVQAQHAHTRPARPKRSARPLCHASERLLRDDFRAAYQAFVAWYRAASARFRRGELDVVFPPLAFKPVGFASRAGPERTMLAA